MVRFPDSSTTNPIRQNIIKKYSSKSTKIAIGTLLAIGLSIGINYFLEFKEYSYGKNNKEIIEYNLMSITYRQLQTKKKQLESQIANLLPYKPKNLEDDLKIIFKEENLEKKLALDRLIESVKTDMENKEKYPAYQEAVKIAHRYSTYGTITLFVGGFLLFISGIGLLSRNNSKREKELQGI